MVTPRRIYIYIKCMCVSEREKEREKEREYEYKWRKKGKRHFFPDSISGSLENFQHKYKLNISGIIVN